MSFIKNIFIKYRNQSPFVQICVLTIIGYYLYAVTTNPIFAFVVDGIVAAFELIYDLLILFVRYFAGIFLTYIVLTILIRRKVYRNIIWFAIGIGVSVLGGYGYFGELSWNPMNFAESYEYIAFEIQVICFYYVVILTMLPTSLWLRISMGFIGMLGAAAYGFSFVPFVGGYIEDLIGMLAKFSLLVFFVLNAASLLLISFEKRIYSLLNRDLSDLALIDIKDAANVQNTIIENMQSKSLLKPHQKESLES